MVFPGLTMEDPVIADPNINPVWATAYKGQVANAAGEGVDAEDVKILGYAPGSVVVNTMIEFASSKFASLDVMNTAAEAMTSKLILTPGSIFTEGVFLEDKYNNVGTVSGSTIKSGAVPNNTPTAAPTTAAPTGAPTAPLARSAVTTPTDSPTSAAPTQMGAGLVSFVILVQMLLYIAAF